ncbi:hypothetical protein [Halosolutus halophilus]|uniref:hypothetical protein n=1 Tax=Halosolutus halophilus TaxID=1552990 RepID=UPI0022350A5E|nr:hypothetical protein [Halosolutus halophilus]
MATKHVLKAADSLGLESVCLPSSINAIRNGMPTCGISQSTKPIRGPPDDPYGIAKHAMEVTADGVGCRPSTDLIIVSLRYPWVRTDEEGTVQIRY